jgi:hypothetical protein
MRQTSDHHRLLGLFDLACTTRIGTYPPDLTFSDELPQ